MEKKLNKRELQAVKTREKLLKTAVQLIIEEGYENVTISQICAKCKVAKGTFYTYFSSKKDIVIEILADVNEKMFGGKVWNTSLPSIQRIMEYIGCYMRTIQDQGPDFTRAFLKIMIEEEFEPQSVGAHLHRKLVEEIINSGKEKGEIRTDISTDKLCRYLQGFIFGIMIDWCKCGGKYDILEEGSGAVFAFLDMIKPNK
ncbi:MAG: TetR/AcrR family transcriptional regulator [Clostridiales bacterium]|jgi:AcrR family transcriptional regulator|nr:TetR/AcrR family transcriptional regulator [Eubacteriales bacterium]MDH7565638.1 TetR/AcrR family transcriptional regulator [Clostridiales bacterium]